MLRPAGFLGSAPAAVGAWLAAIFVVVWLLRLNTINVMSPAGRIASVAVCALIASLFLLGLLLLFRHLHGKGAAAPARPRLLPLVVVAGMTLSLLLLIEGAARVFPVYSSFGTNPGHPFMWPEFGLAPNSLGYKDREPGDKRGPRILILGDSYTEGAGVRRADRFSNVLERLYQETSDPELEVYNAGHAGMDTADEAAILRRTGDRIDPDVVVVMYVVNDANGRGWRRASAKPPSLPERVLRRVPSYAFYRMYARGRTRLRSDQDVVFGQHRADSPGWALVLRSLDQISAWAQERSVPAFLVALPVFADYGERHRPILDQVVATARTYGFRARNSIDDYGGRLAELGVSPYDAHPGREAHRLTAAALHEFVGRPWEANRVAPSRQTLP